MDLKFKDNSQLKLGYTQLEYIESTGTQYIDTGVSGANDNLKIHIRCRVQVAYFPYVASNGYVDEQTNTTRIIGGNNQSNIVVSLNSKPANSLVVSVANIATYNDYFFYKEGSMLKCSVNGSSPASGATVAGAENNTNIILFIGAVAGIAMLKIYDGDTLIRDFIPCKYNGIVCLYDTVSETFFYNQGTGDFIAGHVTSYTIKGLSDNVLLKTTSLYHETTPNVDGLQLLNGILNYQKTHQDEVKEYYYPTTQLWQDIITEYPDILYWYNLNHKLCVIICEADDPEQFTEDLLQLFEDYPDIVDVVVTYPTVAPIILDNPSLIPIVEENPEVVHSLVDTGYRAILYNNGTAFINTNYYISSENVEYEFEINSKGRANCAYVGCEGNSTYGLVIYGSTPSLSCYAGSSARITTFQLSANVFSIQTIKAKNNIISINGNTASFNGTLLKTIPISIYANNNAGTIAEVSDCSYSYFKLYDNDVLVRWLVPIENNDNPCMIDLLTGTKYLNQGSGEFTYSLEPKNT